jgi:hypothetical protein
MVSKNDRKKIVFSFDDFVKVAEGTNFFQDVTNEILKEKGKGTFDELDDKRAQDWNILSGQIVGKET